jgi:hypothetical protein
MVRVQGSRLIAVRARTRASDAQATPTPREEVTLGVVPTLVKLVVTLAAAALAILVLIPAVVAAAASGV